tara:strand:+ start:151 stop:411 length:261 start_codon:yes stop_codon:yes gene_type:complete
MRVQAKIQKWGNGLALRISGVMRKIPSFQEDTEVDVEVTEMGLSVTKTQDIKQKLPFSEQQLLRNMTPESAHADILAKPLSSEFDK